MKKSILLLLIIFLFSCSNDDIENESKNNDAILVKRISYSDGYNDVNITYNGKKIVKMGPVEDGNTYLYYNYEGDLITKIGFSDDENLTATEFTSFIYSNNKLIQTKIFYNNKLQVANDYTYNSDGTIEIKQTGYNGNSNSSVSKNYYDGVGNLIKREKFDNNKLISTTTYTYDNKNNPFKNVTGYFITGSSSNNLISAKYTSTGASSSTIETNNYEYDKMDFPISCSSNRNGRSYVTSYFYE